MNEVLIDTCLHKQGVMDKSEWVIISIDELSYFDETSQWSFWVGNGPRQPMLVVRGTLMDQMVRRVALVEGVSSFPVK